MKVGELSYMVGGRVDDRASHEGVVMVLWVMWSVYLFFFLDSVFQFLPYDRSRVPRMSKYIWGIGFGVVSYFMFFVI